MLNLTADEVQTLMINRGYAVGAGFEKDTLYIKLSEEWTRMQEEQAKQEIPAGFNEYDVESMGIDEIDRLIAAHEANGVKIVLMYAVLKDERGQYYVKDGERIDI